MKYIKAWTVDAKRVQHVNIWQVPDKYGESVFNSVSVQLHNDPGIIDYAVSISDKYIRPRLEDLRGYDNII